MRLSFLPVFLLACNFALAQTVTTSPTFPRADQPVTITVNVTGTSLNNFAWNNDTNPVYLWTWIEKGATDIDAPTNVNPATAAQAAAKCTRISTNPDIYQITITPTTFFNRPASEITQIGLKLKTRDWADNRQTDNDRFISFSQGFDIAFTAPTQTSFFANTGQEINITVNASQSAALTLRQGNTVVKTETGTSLTYTHTVTATTGTETFTCEGVANGETKSISFSYTIRSSTVEAERPAGIIDGINYGADATKVTLSLLAPGKSSVYAVGDFSNWTISSQYQMKKDGEHFWLEITGLTPGVEYGYQYLVDETLRLADPYADKILDPEDQFIPAATYPDLKPYPSQALFSEWYFNRVAVFQTNQTPYVWQTTNFVKPPKEELVIYELLVRDFFDEGFKNYQTLIDTISYFKRLGVNAIELMPVTEFNGNNSWGYNPAFMFAPDKFYGTKNKLKEFIDKCHENGIAVILDMVLNQQDAPNPYALMDFDFTAFKPAATNRWFNRDATHPFNVFFDMNHESAYTQRYVDTVNFYWLNEYKMDGFRFDLSKGFTQKNTGSDVGAWSARDDSRIALLKRMYDKIMANFPDAYVILEHFADNNEEKELSDYGMMLWSNFTGAYAQNTMGFSSGSDIAQMFYLNRGWTMPYNVGYMESHDEERMMYRNLTDGNNSSATHNVRNLQTALNRVKAASTVFYTIPGPKMLWQFGELGYDVSIEEGGRTGPKPVRWNYYSDEDRRSLFDYTSELITLKTTYPVFNTSDATVAGGSSLQKQVTLKSNPYTATPANANEMNVVAVANFDVTAKSVSVTFPHTGSWYNYETGSLFTVSTASTNVPMGPGAYLLFTDFPLKEVIVGLEDEFNSNLFIYPNPASQSLHVAAVDETISKSTLINMSGQEIELTRRDATSWDVSAIEPGIYVLLVESKRAVYKRKVIIK